MEASNSSSDMSDLAQKEKERDNVAKQIGQLRELMKDHGIVAGNLRLNVSAIKGMEFVSASIKVHFDGAESTSFTKSVGEEIECHLKSKENVMIKITVTLTYVVEVDDIETMKDEVFFVELEAKEVPEDTHLEAKYEAKNVESESSISLKIYAAFDSYSSTIESKSIELMQINQSLQEIREKSSNPSPNKKAPKGKAGVKGKKVLKKKVGGGSAAHVAEDEAEAGMMGNIANAVATGVQTAVGMGVEQRAVLMFIACSAAVYAFGDYASI